MDGEKEIRSDAKLKNLPQEALDELWLWRNPVDKDKVWSYRKIQAEVPLRWGFTVSLTTLGKFYAWLRVQRRLVLASSRAAQVREELEKDGGLKPEELDRASQVVFMSEALDCGDVSAYVKLAKLRLTREKHDLEREKLSAASKTKIEAGLDALLAEIQGNPKALKLFNDLKEVVSKA